MTIVGAGAGTTIVERDAGAPDFRIFTALPAHDPTLRGMTIRNGQTIDQCTITGNSGNFGGGVQYAFEDGAVVDSDVSGNSAISYGAGIGAGDGLITISRTTISGNTNAIPGGALMASGTRIAMTDSTVSGNAATGGVDLIGGPAFVGTGRGAEMTATNSTFSGNTGNGITIRCWVRWQATVAQP